MKKLLLAILLLTSLFAEEKTFVREYTYQASEYDSKVTSRVNALEQVKRLLLEEVSVFIISEVDWTQEETIIDGKYTMKDVYEQNIKSITAGITETKVIDEKWNGETYWLQAKIIIDPDDIKKKIKDVVNNKKTLRELNQHKITADSAFAEIEELKQKLNDKDLQINKLELNKKYNRKSANYDLIMRNAYKAEGKLELMMELGIIDTNETNEFMNKPADELEYVNIYDNVIKDDVVFTHFEYHPNSNIKVKGEKYLNHMGELMGKFGYWIYYQENGIKDFECFYQGRLHGEAIYYDKNTLAKMLDNDAPLPTKERISYKTNYYFGLRHGEEIYYKYLRGVKYIRTRQYWDRSRMHGKYITYDDEGNTVRVQEYHYGELIYDSFNK